MFFFSDDEHVGDAFEFVVADFAADLLVAVVDKDADVLLIQLLGYAVGVIVEAFADGEHDDLVWGELDGEFAAGVLD